MLIKILGQGGSSIVYQAVDIDTNEKVAIKMLRKDKSISQEKGAKILETEHITMKLVEGHPNILKTYKGNEVGVVEIEHDFYDAMYNIIEVAENGSLSNIVKHTGGLGENLSKFYFLQICHAISHIHSFGIAHMDIKLSNILLDRFFNIKVADLGIAIDVSQTEGLAESVRGTLWYMAPEVSHLLPTETYDAYKADVYSLGMWLYVMIFGEFPLEDKLSETCSDYESETIGWITGLKCSNDSKLIWKILSEDLQDLLSSMLSMDPDERPSVDEILKEEWLYDTYDIDSNHMVFSEMEQRYNFWSDIAN